MKEEGYEVKKIFLGMIILYMVGNVKDFGFYFIIVYRKLKGF